MIHGNTTLHRVCGINLEEKSSNGTLWVDIRITDNEGSSHEVTCCASDDEMPKITYGPDKVVIDDKLVKDGGNDG